MNKSYMKPFVTFAVAALMSTPLMAQSNSSSSQNSSGSAQSRSSQNSSSTKNPVDGQNSSRSDSRNRSQSNSQGNWETDTYLVPEGWVTIGIDTNGDNRVDTYRTIYEYDLITATKRSNERRGQNKNQTYQSNDQKMVKVQGSISSKKTIQLDGHDNQFVVAKVSGKNEEKTPVLLGAKETLSKLNLQNGDQVTVSGRHGMINDRQVVVAHKVMSDGQTVTTKPKTQKQSQNSGSSHETRQVQGKLENLETRKFQGQSEKFCVADLKMGDSSSRPIVLGPKSKVDQFDLKSGDRISAEVKKGRLNGETALVAKKLIFEGETIQIQKTPEQVKSSDRSSSRREN